VAARSSGQVAPAGAPAPTVTEIATGPLPVVEPGPAGPDATSPRIRPEEWAWLACAALLSLAVRIPFFRIPMLADEGGYAYATRGWLNGSGELYDDLWISRPQGIFFVYAGIFDLFGTGTTAFRFAAWIAIAITLLGVWGFARLGHGACAAIAAAFAFAVMSSSPNLEGYSANAEMFMGCPVALAMLWLLRIGRCGWSRWQLAGVGLLLGVAISLKPSAAVMVPVVCLFVFGVDGSAAVRASLKRCGWFMFGIAAVGVASLVNGWMLGWDNFVYATFTYRLTAQSAATVGLQHNAEAIGRLALRSSALLALVGILVVVRHRYDLGRLLHRRSFPFQKESREWMRTFAPFRARVLAWWNRPRTDARFLLRLWLVASLLGASIGGDWWSHYLIQVVAPLSIWVAWTLVDAWAGMRRVGRYVLVAATVILLLAPYRVLLHGSPANMANAMFSHPGYPAQDKVAAYLREHTDPGTTIYVAFDQASIYYLADRPPAYRHLYDQELRGIPSSYADLISIIRSPDRPEYIVSTRQPGPFADDSRAFWQEVGQYYEVVDTIDGVPIYRDKSKIEPGG